jgi:hypothetical protein
MTSFLLIISFLLHIISITAIFALSKQLMATKPNDDIREIVNLMESYLEDIKHENIALQQELSKTQSTNHVNPKTEENMVPPTINDIENTDNSLPILDEQQVNDQVEVSLQSRILKLYQEGTSMEEIARKLGCGKTEVELIIKFHEKSNI